MDVGREWLNRMHFGDCIRSLNAMPEKFVHTCVTSPPYFGLRDYGSGKWEGGDPDHDHMQEFDKRVVGRNDGGSSTLNQTPFDNKLMGTKAIRPRRVVGRNGVERMYGPDGKAAPGRRDTPTISDHRDIAQLQARTARPNGLTCSCGAVFVDEQIGQEETPEEFVDNLVKVFRAVRRVLRDDGTIWVNLGDSYAGNSVGYAPNAPSNLAGSIQAGRNRADTKGLVNTLAHRRMFEGIKGKDLIGIPWMVAFALRADGWYLRSDVIWNKPNPMPESIQDRPTKAHEYIFLLAKSDRYYYDRDAIAEPAINAGRMQKMGGGKKPNRAYAAGRKPSGNERPDAPPVTISETKNKRSVWTVNAKPYSGAHFATYPEELIEPCILAGSPARGVILDPFMGSGTTAAVAARLERYWVGCELNASNHYLQLERLGRAWLYDEKSPSPRTRVRLNGEGGRVRL